MTQVTCEIDVWSLITICGSASTATDASANASAIATRTETPVQRISVLVASLVAIGRVGRLRKPGATARRLRLEGRRGRVVNPAMTVFVLRPLKFEVPQPVEPATPIVPSSPITPADPDPGSPADPEEPATVPAPQEPPTPIDPDPGPDPEPEQEPEREAA